MRRMSTKLLSAVMVLAGIFLLLASVAPARAETGNRIEIVSVSPTGEGAFLVFDAVEETNDAGLDGSPGTGDEGEDDGFPDPGEEILTQLGSDAVVVTLRNEIKEGVEQGRPLTVRTITATYRNGAGQTPAFAPQRVFQMAARIDPGETADVTIVLIPFSMKVPADPTVRGLRDIFLFPVDPQELADSQEWSVILDVKARDEENGETASDQEAITVGFQNPMVQGN